MILKVNLQTHIKNINDFRFNTSGNIQLVLIQLRVSDADLMVINIVTQKVKPVSWWITFNQLYNFVFYIDQVFLDLVEKFFISIFWHAFFDRQQQILISIDKHNRTQIVRNLTVKEFWLISEVIQALLVWIVVLIL
jgi:hypothetical protein